MEWQKMVFLWWRISAWKSWWELGDFSPRPSWGHPIMVTENLVIYGRPTLGGYIAINPVLEQNRKYLGMKEAVKKMFCEDEESYLDMRNWYRTLFKLKPEFEKRIRDEDLKGGKEK